MFAVNIFLFLIPSFSCSDLESLPIDLFRACNTFTPNHEKQKWRLLDRKSNAQLINTNNNIHNQYLKLIQFIPKMSEQNAFDDETMHQLSQTVNNIRLSEEFLFKIPELLYSTQQILNEADEHIVAQNINQFGNILFQHPNYNITYAKFPFVKLLLFASRQIAFELCQQDVSITTSPKLDCWRFLYGFIFSFDSTQNNQTLLPRLKDIYYLKDNLDYGNKKKQLLFIQELMDKFGVIFYHNTLIYKDWSYGPLQEYTREYLQIRAEMRVLLQEDELLLIFSKEFDIHFLLELLKDGHYDVLSMSADYDMTCLAQMIENAVMDLFEDNKDKQLMELLGNLKRCNGLSLLRDVINDILHDFEIDDCVDFLVMIITINCQYELNKLQILKIAQAINVWFGQRYIGNIDEYLKIIAMELSSVELFNANTINELLNIHSTFAFAADGQHHFIVKMIELLFANRIDWNVGGT